jgi:hypothetical protein
MAYPASPRFLRSKLGRGGNAGGSTASLSCPSLVNRICRMTTAHTNEFPGCLCPEWQVPQGRRPSRAEGARALPSAGHGIPDLPRPGSKSGACAARVIPLPGRRPFPLLPPISPTGRGAAPRCADTPKGRSRLIPAPKFIDIDGKRFLWREILQRRPAVGGSVKS